MLDPSYGNEYRYFRTKSKSWNGDVQSIVDSSSNVSGSGGATVGVVVDECENIFDKSFVGNDNGRETAAGCEASGSSVGDKGNEGGITTSSRLVKSRSRLIL